MTYKWDPKAINSRTERTQLRIDVQREWLKNIMLDNQQQPRLEKQLCKVCHYTSRICGQGFTDYLCQMCGKSCQWHNTCTPSLCLNCAKQNFLCQNCGADVDLKERV